jgi:hypothetical protein
MTMLPALYNITQMFIAWSLQRASVQDVQLYDQVYPKDIELADSVRHASNLT